MQRRRDATLAVLQHCVKIGRGNARISLDEVLG